MSKLKLWNLKRNENSFNNKTIKRYLGLQPIGGIAYEKFGD